MQAPTHVLAGICLSLVIAGNEKSAKPVSKTLLALTALFSHGILDRFARLTYHPPQADFSDAFWVSFHALVLLVFIFLMWQFAKPFFIGIIFSILPDFDWIFIHGAALIGIENPWYSKPYLHEFIYAVFNRTFPFYYLDLIPNLTSEKWRCVWEILLDGILAFFYFFKTKR